MQGRRETLSHVALSISNRRVAEPQLPDAARQSKSIKVPFFFHSTTTSPYPTSHQLFDPPRLDPHKMPRATAGKLWSLLRIEHDSHHPLTSTDHAPGTLIQVDPSIKAIITKINEESGGIYISEDIDDETCLINTKKLDELKQKLKDVNTFISSHRRTPTDASKGPQGHCPRGRGLGLRVERRPSSRSKYLPQSRSHHTLQARSNQVANLGLSIHPHFT